MLEEYDDVFDGLGALPGAYKIAIDEQAQPVGHAPRQVPLALLPRIKNKLDELVDRKVIIPVTEPTQWVSSMLAIVKPNKVGICIDPRDLNRAIRREHYQLPTINEVASCLTGAKKFTLCDAKDGFHQILLDETGLGAVLMQKGQPIAFALRALTDTETRYAQIEKELLAIVWSTDKFNQYILGREVVHIESDHEPLKAVFTKPIHKSPKRLQKILMALQNYSLDVQYKKGELMWISDALSRAYRNTTEASKHDTSLICALAEIDHSENLSIALYGLAELRNEIANDPVMQKLIGAIKGGWTVSRKLGAPELTPYYDKRSELIEDKGLVFLGERLLVPPSLRKEMLKQIHRSHIGIEGCLRQASEVLYWPLMNSEVKDFVSKCSICQSYKPDQCREELQPYPISSRPWSMLGADFFDLGQKQFFLLVEYWSGFFEVQEVKVATSASVIAVCKVQFARHGIPDVLITDNGTQFTSSAFSAFVKEWQFEHRTSSPCYLQSNGRAENAVKTCKSLMKKVRADGQDPLLALLDWCNTPTEGLGTSPVPRLMGRRTRTFLPTHETLLRQPSHLDRAIKLAERKAKQAQQYNKKFRPLVALKCGQAIRM